MLDEVIRYLACPYCGAGLARDRGSLRCGTGHAFDIARQGYVSLLPAGAKGGGGDTAAMVRARLACGPGRACRAHPAAARPGGRHARGDGICLSAACGRPAAGRAGYQFSISSASSDSRWMTASGSAAG
jgi:23S rRNA (guanine745-N1)-methyltransferase